MGDAFFCITLSIFVLRLWWKHNKPPKTERRITPVTGVTQEQLRAAKRIAEERSRNEEDLRKQGYSDELIATILPVMENK